MHFDRTSSLVYSDLLSRHPHPPLYPFKNQTKPKASCSNIIRYVVFHCSLINLSGATLLEKINFLSPSYQLPIAPILSKLGFHVQIHFSCWYLIWLGLVWVLCMLSNPFWVNVSRCVWKTLFPCSHTPCLALKWFLSTLWERNLNHVKRERMIYIPFSTSIL